MINSEEVLKKAEEIFFELAFDNLNESLQNIVQENPKRLYLEISDEVSGDWDELLNQSLDEEDYIEIDVFVERESGKTRLALFLMASDLEENKECHIQWS